MMQKTVLITGCSSGLGKATAKLFQENGWNVIASMRNPEDGIELKQLDNVLVTKLDVTNIDSIKTTIDEGIKKFGKINVLINNAGYGAYGTLESFSKEKIVKQFDTNVIGLIEVTKALLSHFRENKEGTIINISSIGGKMAFPLGALYHGTKFAVEGISESLSYEVEQFGGKVKIIEPGAITTDFSTRSLDFSNDENLIEYQKIVSNMMSNIQVLYKNANSANTIAKIIYEAATDGKDKLRYIAGSDANSFITMRNQLDDKSFTSKVKTFFQI